MKSIPQKSFPVHWTEDKIGRFWDFQANHERNQYNYFSMQKGGSILRMAKRHLQTMEPVLDLGCGRGHFLKLLIQAGIRSFGMDQSHESIHQVQQQCGSYPMFLGASYIKDLKHIPAKDKSFQTIFFIETIEHLLESYIPDIIREMHRVLKPGGHIFLTTPFQENLEASMVECTNCGARFHRFQHLRSIDYSITQWFSKENIRTQLCESIFLLPTLSVWIKSLRKSHSTFFCVECLCEFTTPQNRFITNLWKRFSQQRHKNLIYIGQKS